MRGGAEETLMARRLMLIVAVVAMCATAGSAEAPRYTDVFPPEEFAARRAKRVLKKRA